MELSLLGDSKPEEGCSSLPSRHLLLFILNSNVYTNLHVGLCHVYKEQGLELATGLACLFKLYSVLFKDYGPKEVATDVKSDMSSKG